jgi:hypothetical protein
MRALALIAFFALQLSVFTCGFDIHVHAMESDLGHVAEHLHDKNDTHEQDSTDQGCHVHASHTFAEFGVAQHETTPLLATMHQYALIDVSIKNLPFLIEHPPKPLHS